MSHSISSPAREVWRTNHAYAKFISHLTDGVLALLEPTQYEARRAMHDLYSTAYNRSVASWDAYMLERGIRRG